MKSVLCALCVLCGLTLAAALSPSTVHDDIPGTATIGEVSTAAGARNVQDLNVYTLEKEPYLDDKYFPVCYEGREIPKDNLILKAVTSPGLSYDYFFYERDAFINSMGFTKDGDHVFADGWSFNGKLSSDWPKLSFRQKFTPTSDRIATTGDVAVVDAKAEESLAYSKGVFTYMTGNTNAWFSGTNYPEKATAHLKHRFQFEPGMDLAAVPCSMALWEIRDGERGVVWDQRDWVSWYWSFKSRQMWDQISETNKAIIASIPRKAWGSYTANGLDNPDPSTVWVDRENTTLAAGMAWQNAIVVSGCGYWTIVGNGVTLAPDEKRTSLDIRDFDGKSVMRIIKGESYLAPVTQEDFLAQGVDSAGRITFTIRSNVKPVGEYSTVLDTSSFVAEDSENCPADWEWEQVDDGWKIHFLLKSGIVSNACFARFKVSVEGQSTIEYTTAPTISGGLIYNGVKIAPVINGDTVTWKVVE